MLFVTDSTESYIGKFRQLALLQETLFVLLLMVVVVEGP